MILKLKVLDGKQAGQELPIKKNPFLIGRSEECHLRPHHDDVSRRHCSLEQTDAKVVVRDLGSRTGTFVNGEKITAEKTLKTGDTLRVGPLNFEVIVSVDIKGEKRPAVKSIREAMSRVAEGGEPELDIDNWLTAPASNEDPAAARAKARDAVLKDIQAQSNAAQAAQDAVKEAAAKPTGPQVNSRDAAGDAIRRLTGNR